MCLSAAPSPKQLQPYCRHGCGCPARATRVGRCNTPWPGEVGVFNGAGGVNRAPQNWRGGVFGKRAQLTGPFSSFFFTVWQTMTFLNPLDALIPNIPFSFFFAEFWVISRAGGSVSDIFWGGGRKLSLWGAGGGGVLPRPPHPSEWKALPPQDLLGRS